MMKLKVYGLDYSAAGAAVTRTSQSQYVEVYGALLEETATGLPSLQIMPRINSDGFDFEDNAGIWELSLKIGTGLAFDGSGNLYATGGAGATTLDDLTDVTITSVASGNLLRYSGTAWVNTALVAGDIPNLDTSKLTTGTLGVDRGGTGIASYTTNNYVRASAATTLEQRTPAQVLADISAVSTARTITLTGTANQVAVSAGAQDLSANRTWTLSLPADIDITTSLDVGSVGAISAAMVRVGGDIRASGTIYAADFVLTAGSGSGTGLSLTNLDDVTVTAPATGDFLRYNGSLFVNTTIQNSDLGSGTANATTFLRGDRTWETVSLVGDLDDLSDVTITTASSGHILRHNGSVFVNTTLVAGDIPSLDTSKLTTGTLTVERGGTGAATLTGVLKGNGTGAFTAAVAGTDYVIPSGSVASATTAGTVTTAAQPNITSLGTLTSLQVDNLNLNGNTLSSTAGTDLLITPLAGQQIVLDGTIVIDAGVVTGATSISSTTFVGALTGNASTATSAATLTTSRTIWGQSFNGSANISGALSGATTGVFSGAVNVGELTLTASGARVGFTRNDGAVNVGGVGWHTDSIFYVAGHPSESPGAGSAVRFWGFSSTTALGNSSVGDVLTIALAGTSTFAYGVTVTGTMAATSFSGVGASLTSLNASNIGSGTVPMANLLTTGGGSFSVMASYARQAESVNLNTLIESGVYGMPSGVTNGPSNSYDTLLVLRNSSDVVTQIHVSRSAAGVMSFRGSTSAVWGAWKALVDNTNDQTIGGAKTFSSSLTASAGVVTTGVSSSGSLALTATGANSMVFNTNGSTRLTIDSAGLASFTQAIQLSGGAATLNTAANSVRFGGGGGSPNAGTVCFGDGSGWTFRVGTQIAAAFSTLVTILDTGAVVIGTDPGGTDMLRVAGDITAGGEMTADDFVLSSDRALKDGVRPIFGALDKVRRMNGVLYHMKADSTKSDRAGVIAQELETVAAHAVGIGSDKMKRVAYLQLIPYLIEAIKELAREVEEIRYGS